jgi:hypothetical protein
MKREGGRAMAENEPLMQRWQNYRPSKTMWFWSMLGAAILTICPSSNDLRLFGLWKNGVSGSVCGLI